MCPHYFNKIVEAEGPESPKIGRTRTATPCTKVTETIFQGNDHSFKVNGPLSGYVERVSESHRAGDNPGEDIFVRSTDCRNRTWGLLSCADLGCALSGCIFIHRFILLKPEIRKFCNSISEEKTGKMFH